MQLGRAALAVAASACLNGQAPPELEPEPEPVAEAAQVLGDGASLAATFTGFVMAYFTESPSGVGPMPRRTALSC
jgi:hypothetical protein